MTFRRAIGQHGFRSLRCVRRGIPNPIAITELWPLSAGLQITQGVQLEEAARNFALLLVVPYEVDVVQIVSQGHDKRWQWKLSDDMSWTVTELVP
jgi:hypothetical protein